MDIAISKNGIPVRLTEERWFHISENHDDLAGHYDDVLNAIEDPDYIIEGYAKVFIALEKITKTTELRKALISLGLEEDLERSTNIVRVPSGKPRRRGRKRHTALSCLIVTSKGSPISKLKKSLPGVNVVLAENLSIMDLVPGTKPVRLTIYTKNAIDYMNKIDTIWSRVQSMVKEL